MYAAFKNKLDVKRKSMQLSRKSLAEFCIALKFIVNACKVTQTGDSKIA